MSTAPKCEPTPTPWSRTYSTVKGPDGDFVCITAARIGPHKEGTVEAANADIIVEAGNSFDSLKADVERLRRAIQCAMNIEELWAPNKTWGREHEEEAQALASMRDTFLAALAGDKKQ